MRDPEQQMKARMKDVDDKWACKTDDCHETCDSHPCLIQLGLKESEARLK